MDDLAKNTVSTVIPTMRYKDAPAAIDWLEAAFGFETRLRVPGEDGTIAHAQLTFGNGMIMVSSARDSEYDQLVKTPDDAGGLETQSPYIIVNDVDQHHARALKAGAEIVIDPADEPHGRGYSCRDPQGHLWNFGDYDPWAEA